MSRKQFKGKGCGILNQDFFLLDERLLWVVSGLTLSRSKGQQPAKSGHLPFPKVHTAWDVSQKNDPQPHIL